MHDSAKVAEDPLMIIPESVRESLTTRERPRAEFPPGADIVSGEIPKDAVYLIESGSCRLLGDSPDGPVSLTLLKAPALAGWMSPVSGITGERVRASTAVTAVRIPMEEFRAILNQNPAWADSLRASVTMTELFPALRLVLDQRGLGIAMAPDATRALLPHARLLTEGDDASRGLEVLLDSQNGRRLALPHEKVEGWIGYSGLTGEPRVPQTEAGTPSAPEPGHLSLPAIFGSAPPPYHGATDKEEAVLACLKMLAGQLALPFREEVIRGALKFQLEDRPSATFHRVGSVADMIGIATQPIFLQAQSLGDQDPPFLLFLEEHPVVVQGVSHFGLLIADPMAREEKDRQKWVEWKDLPEPGEKGYQILLCRRSRAPKGEAFGFRSFIPYIRKHTRTFVEVIIASFFIQIFALANPMIIQVIIDKVIVQESLNTLDVLAALLIICTVFGAALTAIRTFLFTDATNRIDLALGLRVLEHLYRLPLSYFHQRPVGEIASRLRELDKIRGFLTGTALTALIDAVFSVIYVAIMLFYSVELTAISLVGVPLLAGLTIFVSPIIRKQLKDRSEKGAATESHLVESLTGIQTIKGQNIETRSRWKWFHRYGETIASSFRNTLTSTTAQTVGTLISRFNDVAVLWVGIYMVVDHRLSLGQLIAFRILSGYVTGPLLRLAQSWQSFQEAALSMNRLGDVANRAREDQDSDEQIPMPPIEGRLSCRDLDFGYVPGKLQLDQVTIDVPAGNLVAMIGLSGSGKSTLLKIIARLYEPVKGRVEIDGFDISKVELNSLRRQIGMVFQETLLMEGSIFDNIAMSDPDAPASAVIEAAKLAEAHDFIMNLPNGYASPVGEQGRNLSGGQRQRIALARLIMQSPSLLILDEATSALDAPTEQRVITNLRAKFAGKTIFFATHRLSTVRLADQIFYLENGVLKETGNHTELMEKKGLYYSLYLQQEAAA